MDRERPLQSLDAGRRTRVAFRRAMAPAIDIRLRPSRSGPEWTAST